MWFSLHTLFGAVAEERRFGVHLLIPDAGTLDSAAAVLAIGAFVAMFRFRVGMMPTLAGGVVLGALWYALAR